MKTILMFFSSYIIKIVLVYRYKYYVAAYAQYPLDTFSGSFPGTQGSCQLVMDLNGETGVMDFGLNSV